MSKRSIFRDSSQLLSHAELCLLPHCPAESKTQGRRPQESSPGTYMARDRDKVWVQAQGQGKEERQWVHRSEQSCKSKASQKGKELSNGKYVQSPLFPPLFQEAHYQNILVPPDLPHHSPAPSGQMASPLWKHQETEDRIQRGTHYLGSCKPLTCLIKQDLRHLPHTHTIAWHAHF